MDPNSEYQSRTPAEGSASQEGFMDGFARSVEMQARVHSRCGRERVEQASGQIHDFMNEIGFDKLDNVISFVEEIGELVIRK